MKVIFKAYLESTKYADAVFEYADTAEKAADMVRQNQYEAIFLDNRIPPVNDFRDTIRKMQSVGWRGKAVLFSGDKIPDLGEKDEDVMISAVFLKDDISPEVIEQLITHQVYINQEDTP